MLHFFRRIRNRLLTQNRLGRYLLYATGEIILVIIGILLALQINNWNEQQKIEAELMNSLKDMTEELEENIEFLSQQKESFETRLERIILLNSNKASTKDMEEVLSYIGQDFGSNPFKKVFESVKDNKSLKLITDKQLIKDINRFYEYSLTSLDNNAEWDQGFVRNNIDPYILENIPSERGIVDAKITKKLMKEIKFKNIINYQSLFYESFINASSKFIKQGEDLQKDLTSYLNSK